MSYRRPSVRCRRSLNESPSEKEGKFFLCLFAIGNVQPSMKVPPKRKGNPGTGRL